MGKRTATPGADSGRKIIVENRKARMRYELLERLEAGIVLTGDEIKSIRAGAVNISEAYVRPEQHAVWLLNAHISRYEHSANPNYQAERPRKLLLHAHEIEKLIARVEQKGLTVVPILLYLKNGRAKVEIAIARGKAAPDRRDDIKKREQNRAIERVMKGRR